MSCLQTKKGIKRKADTTTPNSLDTTITDTVSLPAVTTPISSSQIVSLPGTSMQNLRRESSRTIKRPKKDLPDDEAQHSRRGPMTEQMKYCQTVLRELLSKKHQVMEMISCI